GAGLVAAQLRRYAPVSVLDYYADRYESPQASRVLLTLAVFWGGILYIVLSIVGMSLAMVAIAHLSYLTSLVISTLIVVVYVWFGGMIATTWNAALQAWIMLIAAWAVVAGLVAKVGGWSALWADLTQANPKFFYSGPYNELFVKTLVKANYDPSVLFASGAIGTILFYFTWHFGALSMPYAIVRIFTATDERTARWTLVWAGLIGNLFYIALIIIGSAAVFFIADYHPIAHQLMGHEVEFKGKTMKFEEWPPLVRSIIVLATLAKTYNVPGTNIADYSTLAVAEAVGSNVVLGILTAGALAIAMPTIASWAVLMSTIVSRDWPKHILGGELPPEKEILYARITATILILVGMAIAYKPPALILDMSGAAFVVLVSTLAPPLFFGIWWRRPGKMALLLHVIVIFPLSAFSWLYAKYHWGSPHAFFLDPKYATPHQAYWVFIGFIWFIIVSLLTKPPSRETVEKYVDALHG
ncbi:MAG: hypothetical protein LRS49_00875, partial [Desulfurococcales archaeon]|nr:hypothetical protein [Desulfurococcales archaeon]